MSFHTIIVDDDPILIILMKKIIARVGFPSPPISFENGENALDYFRVNYSPNETYCILLDINMPMMNGWEFLDAIKDFANPKNTFVFVVTSSINQVDIDLANANKFVLQFLSKPIFSETIEKLKKVLLEKVASIH